jgi:prepilin-type N-terminal cleavage/methylation domain-containing protein
MKTNRILIHQTIRGFTLIELMLVISIASVLLVIGLPEMGNFLKNSRLTEKTNTFVAALNFSRSEAITRNNNVFISSHDASVSGDAWGKGWDIWVDGMSSCAAVQKDGQKQDCEILRIFDFSKKTQRPTFDLQGSALSQRSTALVDSSLSDSTIMFSGNDGRAALTSGSAGRALDFWVCDDREGEKGRHLQLRRTGRVVLVNSSLACS